MRVFCRVTAGLEEVISYDLEDRFPDINISEVKWRQISFSLPNANDVLGPIPTVDDIYIFVGDLKKVHHTRSELPRISSFAKKTGYLRHVEKLNKFRSLPERPTFYVTVSRVGKHNYSSPEIREIFIKEI